MQDFDATLYFLDEGELSYLRTEIEREYAHDIRQNVASILFDIYETQTAPEVRAEVAELLEYLMLILLAGGQLRAVAYLLAESQTVVLRAADITSEQKSRLGKLPDRLSAPEPLSQLLQALDESADLPAGAALTELFQQLRPVALGTIFAWLPRLQMVVQRGLAAANSRAMRRMSWAGTPLSRSAHSGVWPRRCSMTNCTATPPKLSRTCGSRKKGGGT